MFVELFMNVSGGLGERAFEAQTKRMQTTHTQSNNVGATE